MKDWRTRDDVFFWLFSFFLLLLLSMKSLPLLYLCLIAPCVFFVFLACRFYFVIYLFMFWVVCVRFLIFFFLVLFYVCGAVV